MSHAVNGQRGNAITMSQCMTMFITIYTKRCIDGLVLQSHSSVSESTTGGMGSRVIYRTEAVTPVKPQGRSLC
jgi:hypothetical protein